PGHGDGDLDVDQRRHGDGGGRAARDARRAELAAQRSVRAGGAPPRPEAVPRPRRAGRAVPEHRHRSPAQRRRDGARDRDQPRVPVGHRLGRRLVVGVGRQHRRRGR
ncbi:MAG: hypothetical protein F9K40_14675, partial [Kofleriaceae bacterium]